MTVNCAPLGPKPQFLLPTGLPAVGGLLFTYVAGSVGTKQSTYTSSTGLSANTNPIVLNALGEPTNEIWLTSGVAYKFVYAPSTDTDPPTSPIWTIDNLRGINDTTGAIDEWVAYGSAPTYVSATSFTLAGDQTSAFHVGRRLKSTVTAGTSYGTITASAFGALTTITVDTTGSNPLDSGLTAVSYGLLRADNFTQSAGLDVVARQSADVVAAATINLDAVGGDLVDVTGATGISAITLARGKERTVRFTGAPTITNGASLVLPGGSNITAAAGDFAIFRGYAAGVVRCLSYVKANGSWPVMSNFTAALGGDVALNNTGTYFDGPTIAQGTVGTWFVWGQVVVNDTAGAAGINLKLWDGTTVIADARISTNGAGDNKTVSLCGYLATPAGNLRISAKDGTSTSGAIKFNATGDGYSKSSVISAIRIA